jgi:hypothetical protein
MIEPYEYRKGEPHIFNVEMQELVFPQPTTHWVFCEGGTVEEGFALPQLAPVAGDVMYPDPWGELWSLDSFPAEEYGKLGTPIAVADLTSEQRALAAESWPEALGPDPLVRPEGTLLQ